MLMHVSAFDLVQEPGHHLADLQLLWCQGARDPADLTSLYWAIKLAHVEPALEPECRVNIHVGIEIR